MLEVFLEIVKYTAFSYIFITDIRKKIISEAGFLILMAVGFIYALLNSNLVSYYLGICSFSIPLLILYIAEDYIGKELIGFGDIKLMMSVGGLVTYHNFSEIIEFYMVLYMLSGITALLLYLYFKWRKVSISYIAFGPFIIMTYIITTYSEIFEFLKLEGL